MAKCEFCGREMQEASGCAWYDVTVDGKEYERIKYEGREGNRCPDCGTMMGHYHHANCDQERCPACGGQLISCDCDVHF